MAHTDLCEIACIDKERVASVTARLESDAVLLRLVETFKILGDHTRLKVIHALSLEELCVCDIASLLNTTASAVSHQLRVLRTMRVVRFRRVGKIVYYSLDDDHIRNLVAEALHHVLECHTSKDAMQ